MQEVSEKYNNDSYRELGAVTGVQTCALPI